MTEFGKFLRARRGGLRPADVGLPARTGPRRTPGVSIDYYVRLERGKETHPSPSVVESLAEALRLDEEERGFLRELAARAARQAPEPRALPSGRVRPTVLALLETLRPHPALVVSRTNDVLAANPGGLRLLHGIADWPERQRNTIRYTFLHPAARELWVNWDQKAQGCVAQLRALAGTDPDAPDLAALVGELIVKSPDFNRLWERYEVRTIGDGEKTLRHPEVGTMTLSHEGLTLNRTHGQRLVVYLAPPGSPDHDAMTLLDLAADPLTGQNTLNTR